VAHANEPEPVRGNAARREGDVPFALGPLGDLLGYNIRIAQLHAFETFGPCVDDTELSPTLAGMLLLIDANPGIKQTDIAAALRVDRSTMVRLVDRCEERKLVKRAPSSVDRRITTPALTARGRTYLAAMLPKISHHEAAIAARLTATERGTLLRLLRRLNGVDE
jgi:DNA-binding MarR family transcriptional regulator